MTQGHNDSLADLAERCEKATGPDRELDWAIIEAVHPGARMLPSEFYRGMFAIEDGHFRLSDFRYTASLDAAMTLVPEGWDSWAAGAEEGYGHAFVARGRASDVQFNSDAATPALALCAAALRSRSS